MRRLMKPLRTRRGGLVALATATLLLAGCGETPLSTLEPQSPIARQLDNILVWLLVAAGVVFVLVQGAVIYMSWKFRVAEPDDPSQVYPDEEFPEQIHGNTRLEIGWTILPTVIMAIVAFFTLGLLFQLDDVTASPFEERQVQSVTVVGQQWWWEFQYHTDDDGIPDIVTANELVLPIGEEVHLDVTSRDVIHSFWVPALNGKRDAVPGRTNPWTIEAGAAGRFPGECTEFCGLSHAFMETFVVGIPLEDWQEWEANQITPAEAPAEGTDAAAGWEVFSANCSSCHIINGLTPVNVDSEGRPVPVLTGKTEGDDFTSVVASFDIYDGATRFIDRQTQVSGAAPNLTHFASRSSFAGGIFELYDNPDSERYIDLAEEGTLNLSLIHI